MRLDEELIRYPAFLKNLNQEEIASLNKITNMKTYEKNQRIIESGEWGDSMYIIFNGLANVNLREENEKYKTIHQMKPGDFFGDIAFFAGIKRSADVVAAQNSTILEITKRNFDEYIIKHPETGCKMLYEITGELARRIVNNNHQMEDLRSYLKK